MRDRMVVMCEIDELMITYVGTMFSIRSLVILANVYVVASGNYIHPSQLTNTPFTCTSKPG